MKRGFTDYIEQTKSGIFPAPERCFSIDPTIMVELEQGFIGVNK